MLVSIGISTPSARKHHLSPYHALCLVDLTKYLSTVRSLQFLAITCPDLSHDINFVCYSIHAPIVSTIQFVKHTFHYVDGTLELSFMGFVYCLNPPFYDYSGAGWAGCP